MPSLPVKRMVLYKHGVGFFERLGTVQNSAQIELTFKKEEMDDVLKSLAAFPQDGAQVINVSYETPEDKTSALAKAPIVLSQNSALLDLLRSLRGRSMRLHLNPNSLTNQQLSQPTASAIAGILLGIDVASTPQPHTDSRRHLDNTLVTLQTSDLNPDSHLRTYKLSQIYGVDILDNRSGEDLRYVLELSRANADKRSVTILLNQPDQNLLVSYIAPTPTWRVSYRLVYTPDAPPSKATTPPATPPNLASAPGKLLLQGWGIVDNQLDEDLDEVELTLMAGQPISFVYDLYTPRLVDRPKVQDEDRTVAGPIMFEEALPETEAARVTTLAMSAPGAVLEEDMEYGASNYQGARSRRAKQPKPAAMRRDMAAATQVKTAGIAKGELFQYDVGNPVSIKRGQSAMVPIIGITLDGQKSHIYNAEKMPHNPVVTLTATNTSGLTLERGPVTVLEDHNYVGEAVLAFTPAAGEFFVPYAVDLGVKITEHRHTANQTAAIRLGEGYLIHDSYHIITLNYTIENRNPQPINLLIEQRIQANYQLFDTPDPVAQTAEFYRWAFTIPARATQTFISRERRMKSRHEYLHDWNYPTLSYYFQQQFIDRTLFDRLGSILNLHQTVARQQKERDHLAQKRQEQLEEQTRIAAQLQPLGTTGEEGKLRQRFVQKMNAIENENERLLQTIQSLENQIQDIQAQIDTALTALASANDESS
ncbi:MAG: hypothetical protein AAGE59_03040 [Cyanobacteria bacterium P01_F01_bin.86]